MRHAIKVAVLAVSLLGWSRGSQARIDLNHTSHHSAAPSQQATSFYVNQKEWALAASAILMEVNNERHDLLGGELTSEDSVESRKLMLSHWWDIHSRADLLQTLQWLSEKGHRADFVSTGEMLFSLTPEEVASAVAHVQDDEEALHQFEVVRQFYPKLGDTSLLAWDLGRYIALCRWGYFVGYFTEQEAWEKIMPAARQLRQNFTSWKELGENYLIGREYWSYRVTKANGEQYQQIYRKLLDDPHSPWNVCPWNTDMTKTRYVGR